MLARRSINRFESRVCETQGVVPALAHSSCKLRVTGFSASGGPGGPCVRASACGSASGLLRASACLLCVTECVADDGGEFAHAGRMSSTRLLPEQAVSRIPPASNRATRTISTLRVRMMHTADAIEAIAAPLPAALVDDVA